MVGGYNGCNMNEPLLFSFYDLIQQHADVLQDEDKSYSLL